MFYLNNKNTDVSLLNLYRDITTGSKHSGEKNSY